MEKITIFNFLDSINQTKEDLMNEETENIYQPYLINHFLSGTIDTLLFANEMNQRPYLNNRMQYDYLKFSINKKYRRARWIKRECDDTNVIQKYYFCNIKRAREILNILTPEQLEIIKKELNNSLNDDKK